MFPNEVVKANMNNQDNKETNIADILGDMHMQIWNFNSKLEDRITKHKSTK